MGNSINQLTEEELKTVEEFSEKIHLEDTSLILNYGSSGQKKAASLSDYILEEMQTREEKEIEKILSGLDDIAKVVSREESKDEKPSFFKKNRKDQKERRLELEKVRIQLDQMADELLILQNNLVKDSLILEKMYKKNQMHSKELTMYLLAGEKKLETEREEREKVLMERAEISGEMCDIQAARDFSANCHQFEKKLHDLDVSRTICTQMEAQIRLLQQNNTKLSGEIQCAVNQTIPLWKNRVGMLLEKS